MSLNDSRPDINYENTNVIKRVFLRILNDPFYFMILHIGNLIVLNAFLSIDFKINVDSNSEKDLMDAYQLQFYFLIVNTAQFFVDMVAHFIVKDFNDIKNHHKLQLVELCFQAISIYYIIQYLQGDALVVQTLFHVNVLRTIRLADILSEMRHIRLLFSSLQAMYGPFISCMI